MAWDASTFKCERDYITEITQSDNEEIATSLAAFLSKFLVSTYWQYVSKDR